ncbi:hypothetical protein CARUB_v10018339mg [Capsella rubella]|uniref:Uncharacterized protein n=1 Tax=Capsella rubella TaxID=81985 RepID=R0HMB5_9BRAS|nr:hypothetical protein CARUB_v10018339mg [Capsella rubella]
MRYKNLMAFAALITEVYKLKRRHFSALIHLFKFANLLFCCFWRTFKPGNNVCLGRLTRISIFGKQINICKLTRRSSW